MFEASSPLLNTTVEFDPLLGVKSGLMYTYGRGASTLAGAVAGHRASAHTTAAAITPDVFIRESLLVRGARTVVILARLGLSRQIFCAANAPGRMSNRHPHRK